MYGKTPIEQGREREDYEDVEEDDEDIDSLVNNMKNDQNVRSTFADLGLGVNILTLMFTGFLFGYFAGSQLVPSSKIAPAAFGLVGLIIALGIEATLVMLRESQMDAQDSTAARKIRRKAKSVQQQVRLDQIHESMKAAMVKMEEWKENSAISDNTSPDDDHHTIFTGTQIRQRKKVKR
jgi:hypothetical protein